MKASEMAGDGESSPVGTIVADRYRIDALLGEGALGTVYRAEHIHIKKPVALKLLHPEIAEKAEFARFEREAIAAARIEHLNVAKAMDFGRLEDGTFYLAIEFIEGKRLAESMKEGPRSAPAALAITRQIASAIQAAHEAGVIHRNLDPGNVMLTRREEQNDYVKVLDFGLAKLATDDSSGESPVTRYGAIVGTPEYMAPEQLGGGTVDRRTDLYALGIILYEMLSGRPPFTDDDRAGIATRHLTETPAPLSDEVPEKTRAIVSDLLEKDPDARIQSAAELIDRIDRAQKQFEHAPTVFSSRASEHGGHVTSATQIAASAPGCSCVSADRLAARHDPQPENEESENRADDGRRRRRSGKCGECGEYACSRARARASGERHGVAGGIRRKPRTRGRG